MAAYLPAKSTRFTADGRMVGKGEERTKSLTRDASPRLKTAAYLPAKSTRFTVDFFSTSLPAAFLNF